MSSPPARLLGQPAHPRPQAWTRRSAFAFRAPSSRNDDWRSSTPPGRRCGGATAVPGAVLLATGLGLAWTGIAGFLRHHTTIVPHHQVSTLVTRGLPDLAPPHVPGLAVAYAGGALLLGLWWPLVLLPFVLVTVRLVVIRPEEQYLATRFGPEYAEYRARVRRWL